LHALGDAQAKANPSKRTNEKRNAVRARRSTKPSRKFDMLDDLITEPKFSAEWRNHINIGDLVSFQFPVSETSEDRGQPKRRPCLVLDFSMRAGTRLLTIAYGTSSSGKANRGYEIAINDPARVLAAGLHKSTRFVGARRIIVPVTHKGFAVSRRIHSPVLGELTGPEFKRLIAVRSRIHADAENAAEYRAMRDQLRLASRTPKAQFSKLSWPRSGAQSIQSNR
jgi:hypothetical protein